MEARQNEIKTIKEIVLQSNSLGGCEGRGELAINGKKAGTIINLPCPSFLPHFYCISMHGEKMHQNVYVLYFLSTQQVTLTAD